MARLRFHVPEQDAGARLDRVLAERPELDSRALAERLIATGAVLVDGEPRAKSFRLEGGEEIDVEIPEAVELQPEELDIPIVWEDEHLLIVDKPAGLVVHPAGSTRTGTLVQGLLAHGAEGGDDDDRPGIVHRLDRDTSGPARRRPLGGGVRAAPGADSLARARAHLRGARAGQAAVGVGADRGADRPRPPRPHAALARHADAARLGDVVRRARRRCAHHALLDVRLETGRTHQIRVHLEAIGLPVSGDPVYGVADDLGLERQFLHAHRLRFEHPLTRAEVDVSSELPPDLDGRARARPRLTPVADVRYHSARSFNTRSTTRRSAPGAVVPRLRDRSPVPSRPAGARHPKPH